MKWKEIQKGNPPKNGVISILFHDMDLKKLDCYHDNLIRIKKPFSLIGREKVWKNYCGGKLGKEIKFLKIFK